MGHFDDSILLLEYIKVYVSDLISTYDSCETKVNHLISTTKPFDKDSDSVL